MAPQSRVMRIIAGIFGFLFFGTNCLFAYSTESNLWAERRRAREQRSSPTLLASLPVGASTPALFSQLPPPQKLGPALSQPVARSVPKSFLKDHADLLAALSPAYGTIRKVSLSPKPSTLSPIVIHIQDVHQNFDAQKNIGQLVGSLVNAHQATLIALEGTWGDIKLQPFRDFANRKAVELSADYLLKENKISGPIHAALIGTGPLPPVVGIDDPAHYNANVDAYRQSAPHLEELKKELAAHKAILEQEKKRVFSSELKTLDDAVESYRFGRSGLGDYVQAVSHPSFNLTLPPSIQTFQKTISMERTMDFKQVENERASLINRLVEKMSRPEMDELTAQSVAYRSGEVSYANFYNYLQGVCSKAGVSLQSFLAMREYIQYVLLADGITAETLFDDLMSLERMAYSKLAKTPEAMAAVKKARSAYLTGKLVDFSLTPEEWKEYRSLSITDKSLSSFENFYREADARDHAMAENLLNAIQTGKSLQVSILVTGGYHSPGLTAQLTQAGATVISVVPKIEKLETTQGSTYLSVFTQEKTPLDKLFAGEKLFLAQDPISKPTRQITAPTLVVLTSILLGDASGLVGLNAAFHSLGGLGLLSDLTQMGSESVGTFLSAGGALFMATVSKDNSGGVTDLFITPKAKTDENEITELVDVAQPLVNFLSAGDDVHQDRPDVFVVSGSNDLRAYVEFFKLWKDLGGTIPVVVAGGRGSGTTLLARECLSYYGEKLDSEQRDLLDRALLPNSLVTESSMILNVVFLQEGLLEGDRHYFHGETRPSSSTRQNMLNVAEDLARLLDKKNRSKVALVNTPTVLLRQYLNAVEIWQNELENDWAIQRVATYKPELSEMDTNDLIATISRAAGYPEGVHPSLRTTGELEGCRAGLQAIPENEMREINLAHWETEANQIKPLFGKFLSSVGAEYDPSANLMLVPQGKSHSLERNGDITVAGQEDILNNLSKNGGTGRATSLWGVWLAEFLFGKRFSNENIGKVYKALAPVIGTGLALSTTVLAWGGLVVLNGSAVVGVVAPLVGAVFGLIYLASHSNYLLPKSWLPESHSRKNISFPKVLTMAFLYAASITLSLWGIYDIEMLGLNSNQIGILSRLLWPLALLSHGFFDDWLGSIKQVVHFLVTAHNSSPNSLLVLVIVSNASLIWGIVTSFILDRVLIKRGVRESKIGDESLKKMLLDEFGVHVASLEDLPGGIRSLTYGAPRFIRTTSGELFVFRRAGSSDLAGRFSVSFQRYLHAKGLPAPAVFPRRPRDDGPAEADRFIIDWEGHPMALEQFMVQGAQVARNQADERHYRALGRLAAEINNAAVDFQSSQPFVAKDRRGIGLGLHSKITDLIVQRERLRAKRDSGSLLTIEEKYFVQNADEIIRLFEKHLALFLNRYTDELCASFPDFKGKSVIHSDLNFGNIRFETKPDGTVKAVALFDFEARMDQRITEFNNLLMGREFRGEKVIVRPEMVLASLEGFSEAASAPLADSERTGVWEILRLRLLEDLSKPMTEKTTIEDMSGPLEGLRQFPEDPGQALAPPGQKDRATDQDQKINVKGDGHNKLTSGIDAGGATSLWGVSIVEVLFRKWFVVFVLLVPFLFFGDPALSNPFALDGSALGFKGLLPFLLGSIKNHVGVGFGPGPIGHFTAVAKVMDVGSYPRGKWRMPKAREFPGATFRLIMNTPVFDTEGKSRVDFKRVENTLSLDGKDVPFTSTTLNEVRGEPPHVDPSDVLALLPNGNLGLNDWFVGFANGTFYHTSREEWETRTYEMLVQPVEGRPRVQTLRFNLVNGKWNAYDATTSYDVTNAISFAVYGQRIVKEGVNNVENLAEQFDDLRHLLRIPMFDFPGNPQFHFGFNDGSGELYHDRQKVTAALKGEPVTLSLQPLEDHHITVAERDKVFTTWGYIRRPDTTPLKDLKPGDYVASEKGKSLTMRFLPGIHPHSFFGLSQSGELMAGLVPGQTHHEGTSVHELANHLVADKAQDVFLWANGKDAKVLGSSLSGESDNARAGFLAAIAIQSLAPSGSNDASNVVDNLDARSTDLGVDKFMDGKARLTVEDESRRAKKGEGMLLAESSIDDGKGDIVLFVDFRSVETTKARQDLAAFIHGKPNARIITDAENLTLPGVAANRILLRPEVFSPLRTPEGIPLGLVQVSLAGLEDDLFEISKAGNGLQFMQTAVIQLKSEGVSEDRQDVLHAIERSWVLNALFQLSVPSRSLDWHGIIKTLTVIARNA